MTDPSQNDPLPAVPLPIRPPLRWPDTVRKRPLMYLASADALGLLRLAAILIDNSLDEVLQGAATRIEVVIDPRGILTVQDNGRGIPVETVVEGAPSFLEWLLTKPLGKRPSGTTRTTSLGLGLSISTVNALAAWLQVEVRRNGKVYVQEYRQGLPTTMLKEVTDTLPGSGTRISFVADPEIFGPIEHDAELLVAHLQDLAYLVPGVEIRFADERAGQERVTVLRCRDGIRAWVRHLNRYGYNYTPEQPLYARGMNGNVFVEVAWQHTWTGTQQILAFVNNGRTHPEGPHVQGFLRALSSIVNQYGRDHKILKKQDRDITPDIIPIGICAAINVRLPDPQYGTFTTHFVSPVDQIVEAVVSPVWQRFVEENPDAVRPIIGYWASQLRRTYRRKTQRSKPTDPTEC